MSKLDPDYYLRCRFRDAEALAEAGFPGGLAF